MPFQNEILLDYIRSEYNNIEVSNDVLNALKYWKLGMEPSIYTITAADSMSLDKDSVDRCMHIVI